MIAEASEEVEYYDDQVLKAKRIVICRPLLPEISEHTWNSVALNHKGKMRYVDDDTIEIFD